MKIAIDGPAGSGKSTVAKLLSKILGFEYIDTGAMYRCVALYLKNNEYDFNSLDNLKKIDELKDINISFNGNNIRLNNKTIQNEIRTSEISNLASKVAENFHVREYLVDEQRKISNSSKNIILDGRDIGSNVLPDADFKFYIDASVEIRAKRRFLEEKHLNENIEISGIEKDIIERDKRDKEREFSPLIKCGDAIYILTDDYNIDQVLDLVLSKINNN